MRRRFLIRLAVAALGTPLMTACRGTLPAAPPAPLTESQARYLESRQRMLQRFGRPGFELVVDAVPGQEFLGVEFFPQHAARVFYASSAQSLRNQTKMI
ncbi:MAG TPA: hypothetical protein PKJ44_10135, partial [Thauera aminoaromatica]|nr:hypothetical protein [Thauera aminoaromatica]